MNTAAQRTHRLIGVVLAALVVRAAYLVFYLNSPLAGIYRADHIYYRTWAMEIAAGAWIGSGPFEHAPLYAYLLAAGYRLFGDRDPAMLALQMLAGTATVLLIMWIAERLFDRPAALLAGAFAAVYGPAVFYECMIMKNWLEPLLVLAALAAALRAADSAGWRWPAAAGAAVGLACLVREVYILLLAPPLLASWACRGPGGRRARLAFGAALLAATLLTVSPAALHNRLAGKDFVGVSVVGGENAYLAFGPEATGFYAIPPFLGPYPYIEHQDFRDEAFLRTRQPHSPAASSRYWLGVTADHIRAQPLATARLLLRKAAILFADFEVPDSENFTATRGYIPLLRLLPTFGWFVGLGFLGAGLACLQPRRHLLPLGFAAALIAMILLTYNVGRYRSALVAVWLMFAGRGAAWLWAALVRPGDRRDAGLAALAAVFVASALSFLPPAGLVQALRDGALSRFREETAQNAGIRETIPALQRAVAASPRDAAALLELGKAMEKTGRVPEAVAMYEAALREDPVLTEGLLRLSDLLVRLNQPARAVQPAEALAKQGDSPDGWFARYLLGRIALLQAAGAPSFAAAQPALARAIDELRAVAEAQPGDLQVRLKLARAYHLAGDAAAARAELRTVLAIDPGSREGFSLARTIFAR